MALVEDGAQDAAAFRRVFGEYGDVVVWGSGEEAVAAMSGPGPSPRALSMLVVDVGLPGMDGVDVIRAVRAMPSGGHAAIFSMTGSTDPGIAQRALAAGADDHIVKPADLAGLREIAAHLASITSDADVVAESERKR